MRTVIYGWVALAMAMAAAGCAPMSESRGNALDPALVEEIEPGRHDRAQVAQILGTPSSTSAFDKNTWYYISKNTEQMAFFDPKIVGQKVIVVKFDESGLVSEIKEYDGKEARKVELVERVTPTRGQEQSLMGQLFNTLLRGAGSALGDSSEENDGFIR